MKIPISIENKGFLLLGAGEGSALVNIDPVVTPEGYPYFPARTLKGLLKESVKEVLEIEGKGEEVEAVCQALFGQRGSATQAPLRFNNLYLDDWSDVEKALPAYRRKYPHAFEPQRITASYTWEIAQTAVNRQDGIAEDHSLRNIRVVRPGQVFSGVLELKDQELLQKYKEILVKAGHQLRFAGSKRNRGFGAIKVNIEADKAYQDKARNSLVGALPGGKLPVALKIRLTTRSATVLSALTGDRNTVSSDPFVRGSRIRGLVAERLIQSLSLEDLAHQNNLFKEGVLADQIHYQPAYPKDTIPVPLNLHRVKGEDESHLLDIFRQKGKPAKNTRTVGGLGKIDNQELRKFRPQVTARFHNSRPNRSAGKSMEGDEDGGIFYYEGINAQQIFQGRILGKPQTLAALYKAMAGSWDTRMGKSKSAQYGEVEIAIEAEFERDEIPNLEGVGEVLLHFRSPVILLNGHGIAQASQESLLASLKQAGIEVTVEQAAVQTYLAEGWNQEWQARTGQIPAFKEGSVFLLKALNGEEATWQEKWSHLLQTGLGESQNQGFGWIEAEPWEQFPREMKQEPWIEEEARPALQPVEGLEKILEVYRKEEKRNRVQYHAIQSRHARRSIPNHLLARLEQKLDDVFKSSASNFNLKRFTTWLQALESKKAGRTLKRQRLFDPLLKFQEIVPSAEISSDKVGEARHNPNIEMAREAWKTIFQTIRNQNKASQNPKNPMPDETNE